MTNFLAYRPLARWERVSLAILLAITLLFGLLVEYRAAFQRTRKGDQEIYFRSAHAVRAGENLYDVVDSHGWHYTYPPLFAILMVPFAEPPPDQADGLWTVAYPLSVAIWYLFNVAVLCAAVHVLARSVEQTMTAPPPAGSARWWRLRVWPVVVCLVPVGHTLMRGQANLLVLALIAGMAAALLAGRNGLAGVSLAGAISLKLFPAFLLIWPLWRRDRRFLAGCAAGLLVFLGLVPVLVFGPEQTVQYYRDFAAKVVLPGLGQGMDDSRSRELTALDATHSQSFLAAIHAIVEQGRRIPEARPAVRIAHWLAVGIAAAVVLAAAGTRPLSGPALLLLLGSLSLLMVLASPVCHTHYYCHAIPLIMGLMAVRWEDGHTPGLSAGFRAILILFALVQLVIQFPGLEKVRDLAAGIYPALLLLGVAVMLIYRRRRVASGGSDKPTDSSPWAYSRRSVTVR